MIIKTKINLKLMLKFSGKTGHLKKERNYSQPKSTAIDV